MNEELMLQMEDDNPINLVIDEDIIVVNSNDYEELSNKPSINNITLLGNKNMNDLFPDGLIIDGGTAPEVSP